MHLPITTPNSFFAPPPQAPGPFSGSGTVLRTTPPSCTALPLMVAWKAGLQVGGGGDWGNAIPALQKSYLWTAGRWDGAAVGQGDPDAEAPSGEIGVGRGGDPFCYSRVHFRPGWGSAPSPAKVGHFFSVTAGGWTLLLILCETLILDPIIFFLQPRRAPSQCEVGLRGSL